MRFILQSLKVSRLLHIKVKLAVVFALGAIVAACGNDSSSTTAPTTPAPMAGTDTITGQMAPGGVAMHQFTASATGTAVITLTVTDPPSTLVGLGIGIPGGNSGQCDLTKTVQTRPGATAQLSAGVEAGSYCAGTFDIGGLPTRGVLVTYTVAHP
jgi:hypothetical protein